MTLKSLKPFYMLFLGHWFHHSPRLKHCGSKHMRNTDLKKGSANNLWNIWRLFLYRKSGRNLDLSVTSIGSLWVNRKLCCVIWNNGCSCLFLSGKVWQFAENTRQGTQALPVLSLHSSGEGIWFLGCKRKELGCTKFPSCFLFGPDSLNSLNV